MTPPNPTITLEQAKAIREIEQRLTELERMRQCINGEMPHYTEAKSNGKGYSARPTQRSRLRKRTENGRARQ